MRESSSHDPLTAAELEAWMLRHLAALLGRDPAALDPEIPFAELGIVSRDLVELSALLEDWTGGEVPATAAYEHATPRALARALAGAPRIGAAVEAGPGATVEPGAGAVVEPGAVEAGAGAASGRRPGRAGLAIAVVGAGCRLPGAEGPEALWDLLLAGTTTAGPVPVDRWPGKAAAGGAPATGALPGGSFLADVAAFDAPFFRISPREGQQMDPQQRLLLEVTWHALEHAGIAPDALAGSATGVFVGLSSADYWQRLRDEGGGGERLPTACAGSIAANRISYLLDLRGPSLVVDTACSSSLVAVELACRALREGTCDLAVAAGANVLADPVLHASLAAAGLLSPDGRCKAFDAAADGYGRGEGCGAVVLKRLEDATRDGDRVLAVVAGAATGQDGRSNGLTAPNGGAQEDLVRRALREAGAGGHEIGFVEAHGTGTRLGDPVELRALRRALCEGRAPGDPCRVGSLKANIGHLEAAAGIAALIKAVLCLWHGAVPGQPELREVNPLLPLDEDLLRVATATGPWTGESRFAGVSSFGFGGTLAHVVLAAAPARPELPAVPEVPCVLPLSAGSDEALGRLAAAYADHLEAHPEISLPVVCAAAALRRARLTRRAAVVARDREQTVAALRRLAAGEPGPGEAGRSVAGAAAGTPEAVARAWTAGAPVDWRAFFAALGVPGSPLPPDLPRTPFVRQRLWLEAAAPAATAVNAPAATATATADAAVAGTTTPEPLPPAPATGLPGPPAAPADEAVLPRVQEIVASLLGMQADQVRPDAAFLELGADSVLLAGLTQRLRDAFGLDLSIRQLFEDIPRVRDLAEHVRRHAASRPAAAPGQSAAQPSAAAHPAGAALPPDPLTPGALTPGGAGPDSRLESIVREQLRVMSQQLALLSGQGAAAMPLAAGGAAADRPREQAPPAPRPSQGPPPPEPAGRGAPLPRPAAGAPRLPARTTMDLSPAGQAWLDGFVRRYSQRTRGSKAATQRHRRVLADNRNVLGLRRATKELLYPIVSSRSEGSRLWDVDGNPYVDLAMGFGVNLFGHRPAFVQEAVRRQLERGVEIGPQSPLAGRAAELVTRLTGHERVTFTNSGTEAVMCALRLARAATGRSRVALFAGSYHGTFDGVLARASTAGDGRSVPLAPGVTDHLVGDLVVLEYGAAESLDWLRRHAGDLAAVLVEPVQSRHPELRPVEFVRELRALTERAGTALILDEMITGFRCHPAGAAAFYGVRADLATYGKVVGGGYPIGVVAGRSELMDHVDGGWWQFGDDSMPADFDTTFFGGTFCKHPVAMTAAVAVLEELERRGPALQEELDARTAALMATLRSTVEAAGVPLETRSFSSLFRFEYPGDPEMLYFGLIDRGVYVWEGRNFFLSTAHTDRDVDYVAEAFADTVAELQQAGVFPGTPQRQARCAMQPDVREIPTTVAQRELFELCHLGPAASLAYTEGFALRLDGALDAGRLERSFRAVIRRHGALRAGVDPEGLRLRVHPEAALALRRIEPGDDCPEDELLELLADPGKPFDLAAPSLLRATLAATSRGAWLAVHFHHVVLDGWSMQLVLEEAGARYEAPDREPDPPPASLAAYARRESEYLASAELAADLGWWEERFAGGIPAWDPPTDRPRPAAPRHAGARVSAAPGAGFGDAAGQLARACGCTPFTALLAAWSAVLQHFTGSDAVVVGVPAADRDLPGGDRLVGSCTQLLPLPCRREGSSFRESARSLHRLVVAALDRRRVPFSTLVRHLRPERSGDGRPLVGAGFNLETLPPVASLFGLPAEVVALPIRHAKRELHLNLTRTPAGYLVDLDYDSDLFDPQTAKALGERFQRLVRLAAADPDLPIATLLAPSEEERRQIAAWSRTAVHPSGGGIGGGAETLHGRFLAQASRAPEAIAVEGPGGALGYGALSAWSAHLAAALAAAGVGRGDVVAVALPREASLVAAVLGVLRAGAAFLPLAPDDPPAYRRQLAAAAAARAVVAAPGGWDGELPVLDPAPPPASDAPPGPSAAPRDRADGDDAAYVIFTSGSTGAPKGVVVPHRAIVGYLAWAATTYGLGGPAAVPLCTAVTADLTLTSLLGPLVSGGRLRLVAAADPVAAVRAAAAGPAALLKLTPSHLEVLGDPPGPAPGVLVVGGEALHGRALEPWLRLRPAPRIVNEYGPTEAAVGCCAFELPAGTAAERLAAGPVPIGRPLPGVRLHVVSAGGEPVAPGIAGELWIGGPGLARGYVGRPGATAERFVPDPFGGEPGARLYRSGDRVRLGSGGELEFLGRRDAQVKVRGFRVEPAEVAAALASHGAVGEAAVVPSRAPGGEARLVAYYTAAGDDPGPERLRRHLQGLLPEPMVPSAFVCLDRLPLTRSGKLDRGALPAAGREARTAAAFTAPAGDVERRIAEVWQRVLGVERIGRHDTFFDLGGDSLQLIASQRALAQTGLDVPAADLFRWPTPAALAGAVGGVPAAAATARAEAPAPDAPPAGRAVAIVGMSLRVPGAATVEGFWDVLAAGRETLTRQEPEAAARPPGDGRFVPVAGLLDDVYGFDHGLFRMTPREAETTDPQHRVLLECAWEALEHAGCDPGRSGERVGVFVGAGFGTYLLGRPEGEIDRAAVLAADKDFLATRISYKLGLRGPSLTVQTACSTSLVAVHLACRSLRAGECDVALVGGVSILLPQPAGYLHEPGGIESADGHCRPFDAGASGTVFGNGAGIVVLKRLDDAARDGDTVLAVVRGSAVNNDGGGKMSFTAPDPAGQAVVIREALRDAGVPAASLDYVEAHGTGTSLGDAVEVAALAEVLRERTAAEPCGIGSVKGNLGHLDTAAGVVGLAKVALALHHRTLVPSLHFDRPHLEVDLAGARLRVETATRPWPGPGPRRAGVSSFGIGGTNAHAVLEEAPPRPAAAAASGRRDHLLVLAAADGTGLEALRHRLAGHLERPDAPPLADVAHTLLSRRHRSEARQAVVCSADDAAARLREDAGGPDGAWEDDLREDRPVVFLLPGQGAVDPAAVRALHAAEPRFRELLDEGLGLLAEPLRSILRRELLQPGGDPAALEPTDRNQVAVFLLDWTLARLWQAWGVRPAALLGHSLGEWVAACLAGVASPAEVLELVAERGRLMAAQPPGAMTAVAAAPGPLQAVLPAAVAVAAVNADERFVISGPAAAIERAEAELRRREVPFRRLAGSHAFHSALMEPAAEAFRAALAGRRFRDPGIPVVSSVTGAWAGGEELRDPDHWAAQIRRPVRFRDALRTLLERHPDAAVVEVGVHQGLAGFLDRSRRAPGVSTLPHPGRGEPAPRHLLAAAGALWASGVALDAAGMATGTAPRRVPLPTTPFRHTEHRLPEPARPQHRPEGPLRAYETDWRRAHRDASRRLPGGEVWVLAGPAGELAERLAAEATARGVDVLRIVPGDGFEERLDGALQMDLARRSDQQELVQALRRRQVRPARWIHLQDPRDADDWLRLAGLVHGPAAQHALEVEVVTLGAQEVGPGDLPRPEGAALVAAALVLGREVPGLARRVLDLDPRGSAAAQAAMLVSEWCSGAEDVEVAFRGDLRFVPVHRPRPLVPGDAGLVRPGGHYLITGGLGPVAHQVGLALARHGAGRLILVGRHGLPARRNWDALCASPGSPAELRRRIQRVRDLEARGVEVRVAVADVAETEALAALVAGLEPLHGVVHAAGITGAESMCALADTGVAQARLHFGAKVAGLRTLRAVLGTRPVDFVLAVSSLSAELGGVGLGAYAAANRAMDALAQRWDRRDGVRWIAVDWDAWSFEPGHGAGNGTGSGSGNGSGILPADAPAALDAVLGADVPTRLLVAAGGLESRRPRWREEAAAAAPPAADGAPPAGYQAGSTLEVLRRIWQDTLGLETIAPEDDFFALGGDSLTALRVTSHVRQALGTEVTLKTLFAAPTLGALAAAVGTGDRPPSAADGAASDDPPPLTFAQERLWVLEQLAPGQRLYDVPLGLRLAGRLDAEALRAALSRLRQRHPMLRTTFGSYQGKTWQVIHPPEELRLPTVEVAAVDGASVDGAGPDVSADRAPLSMEEREAAAWRRLEEDAAQPIDLLSGPLFRSVLYRVAPDLHLLLLGFHHIVCDEWSLGLLSKELGQLYNGLLEGREAELPPVPTTYAAWARHERSRADGEREARDLAFWRERLAGAPALRLPCDRQRSAERSWRGAREPVEISSELASRLAEVGREAGATLYMTLLAAFAALLEHYTGQDDLAIATPTANRETPEIERVFGLFANTLVLRVALAGDPPFAAALGRVRDTVIDAMDHQGLPFDRLVKALGVPRDGALSPLAQVMFTFLDVPLGGLDLHGLEVQPVRLDTGTSKFDLSIDLAVVPGGGLAGALEYDTDLFDSATVRRLKRHFLRLLDQVAHHPQRRLSGLEILDEQDLLVLAPAPSGGPGGADAAADALPELVHAPILARAGEAPGAPAVCSAAGSLTYGELAARARVLASRLRQQGVGVDNRVGILMAPGEDLAVAVLGTLLAGAAFVPLDPEHPRQRLERIAGDAGLSLLLAGPAAPPLAAGVPRLEIAEVVAAAQGESTGAAAEGADATAGAAVETAAETAAAAGEEPALPGLGPQAAAWILYTSGSTGQPKGVVVSHGAAANYLHWARRTYVDAAGGPGRGSLLHTSIAFDLTLTSLLVPLWAGQPVHLVAGRSPRALLERLQEAGPLAFLKATPSHLDALAEDLRGGASVRGAVHGLVLGGEALRAGHLQEWLARDGAVRVINEYGPTEATVGCCVHEVAAPPTGAIPIGRAIDRTRLYVLDRRGRRVPPGVPGELHIAGAPLARGYLGRPGATAAAFVPDPFAGGAEGPFAGGGGRPAARGGERMYRTGDLARFRADGVLEYLGRIDRQVKLLGQRIELGEVEAALERLDGVEGSAAYLCEGRLIACLRLAEGLELEPRLLRRALAQRLPAAAVPAQFLTVDRFPTTAGGKLDYDALPRPRLAAVAAGSGRAAANREERLLAKIWADLLAVPEVAADADFFSLGGDSILALQVASRALAAGLQLSPQLIFQNPTIADLAAAAGVAAAAADAGQGAEQGLVTGEVPLTPIQHWFLDDDPIDPHHFNQSVPLSLHREVDPALLRQVTLRLLEHHDALRLRFERRDDGWHQRCVDSVDANAFLHVDLGFVAAETREARLRSALEATVHRLDLGHGPLFQLVLFSLPDAPDVVLLLAHHLVVDGVSWRVLLEDFLTLLDDPAAPLPAKSVSFRDWAWHLVDQVGREDALEAEQEYWLSRSWRTPDPLPMERDQGRGVDTVGTAETHTVVLERAALRRLQDVLAGLDGIGLQDVLLAAAVEVVSRWTGQPELLVEIERHGREPVFGNLDLSRTVGYVTSAYPVLLRHEDGPADARVAAIARALGAPRTGLAYGLLRFLHPDPAVRARLAALPRPQLRFNYLGRFDTLLPPDAPVSYPVTPAAPGRSPRARRDVPLELHALTVEDGLRIDWSWSGLRHRAETMAALGREIGAAVERLSRELQEICAPDLRYPVTGLQAAMLYATAMHPEALPYQHQMRIDLRGEVDPDRLAAAWERVVARHDTLRTRFAIDGDGVATARVEAAGPPLQVIELAGDTAQERERHLAEVARAELERGFRFDREPALRVTLAGSAGGPWSLLLTHHQVALDGWSVALLLEDWLRAADRLRAGDAGPLDPAPPFRRYVEWLAGRPVADEQRFWRRQVAELPPPPWTDGAADPAPPSLAELEVVERCLSEEATAACVAAARTHRLTLSTLAAGAWALVSGRRTAGSEVVFGMTVSGRPPELAAVSEMLGLFINAVPVRVEIPEHDTALAWLHDLQARLAELREHCYTSLAEIRRLAGLAPNRLLFDSVFVFENYPVGRALENPGDGLHLEVRHSIESSDLPVTALVVPGPALRLQLSVDRRRIPAADVGAMIDGWAEILQALAADPERPLVDLVPPPAAALDLLAGFNDEL